MRKEHRVSIANAFIWAAVIIATAVILRGTDQAAMVTVILGGAAGASILLVSDVLRKKGR
jgi:hypothetical protein